MLEPEPAEPIRAILLDALGTLLELEPPAPFLRTAVQDRFGVQLSETDAQRAIAAEISYYRAHLDEGQDADGLARLRERCAEALREAMPAQVRRRLPGPPDLVEALLASLRFRLFDEVRDALTDYRVRGLRLVVVSNWDVSLHRVLANLGLAPLLDGVITSAEAGARKPSPAIFRQALRLVGARAGETIHVGDSLDEDIAGARSAGIEPVLVRRDGSAPPGDVRTISRLTELLD